MDRRTAPAGLLRPSFIPPRPTRELRDLTRQRTKWVGEKATVANRVQKILEDADIKLGSVASNALGKSGRDMFEALIRGESDPAKLADLARRRLGAKLPQLREALHGSVTEHHRFLSRTLMDHLAHLESLIGRYDRRIGEALLPSWGSVRRLATIPGVDVRVAEVVLAEIGTDMGRFPTAGHLSSWAGIASGNNESAGKRRSGRTPPGNHWLKTALVEAAWAASRAKDRPREPIQSLGGAGEWDDEAVMAEPRGHVREGLAEFSGVAVIEPGTFPKEGAESRGVARRWCGRLGKGDDGQVGVSLAYAAEGGDVPLDRRPDLPGTRAADEGRREKCHVPPEIEFREGWRIAPESPDRSPPGSPHGRIVGDDEFGRASAFRLREGRYVPDVPCDATVRNLERRRPPRKRAGVGRRRGCRSSVPTPGRRAGRSPAGRESPCAAARRGRRSSTR